MIELQTQVQQLLDMVQRLQSTVDSRFGLVQHLVEQSTDNVNQMNATIAAMQQKLNAQSESTGGKLDAVSGQVQSLNDSLDELKTRIAKLDKQMQDIQSQLQNVQSQSAANPGLQQPGQQPAQTAAPDAGNGAPPTGGNDAAGLPAAASDQVQAPPLQETYQGGLRDYNAAHYDLAMTEFDDVLHYYPNDNLAGNAQFYLGEISYRQQKYKDAIKAYNAVLENFSGNPKAPAAQLRKGYALLQLNQKESGVHELRSLIQRYPQTPEALQARSKLNALGVRINPR
jgi:tol-pal system protein YbgF